jgi:hypothetical protein
MRQVPDARWLNILINRVNPYLFSDCFMAWATKFHPSLPQHIAIDRKTLRRSHEDSVGKATLHLVSAFATHGRLIPGQEATSEKAKPQPFLFCCYVWRTMGITL